ncbi:MAG TPA: (2Fe-2S)-binding protein [Stellaceae bacterium]|nr:(2Fe-2S)-binding protein [Stellaceae bacterium]
MYVCLCNGLTDRQVRGAAGSAKCSPAGVYRALGVRPQCGKCVPLMREILRDHSEAAASAPGGVPVPA